MFNKKDYIIFIDQLYKIELEMEKEAIELQKMVDDTEIKKMLQDIIDDERKHKKIVQAMKDLV